MELNKFLELFNQGGISTIIDVWNKSSIEGVILPFYVNNLSAKNESEGRAFYSETYNKISSYEKKRWKDRNRTIMLHLVTKQLQLDEKLMQLFIFKYG
jgi:hypothetical protein